MSAIACRHTEKKKRRRKKKKGYNKRKIKRRKHILKHNRWQCLLGSINYYLLVKL